jgi:outer membrane biogenesis lipoprotein LolB
MTVRPRSWILVASLLALHACAKPGPDPFAALPTVPYSVEPSLLEGLERYRSGQAQLHSLRGRARGTATEDGKKRAFKQAFAVVLPSSVRLEIQTSIGQTVALFTSDGQTLYYKDRESDPTVAPADRESVENTLGYSLEVEELIATLLGRVEAPSVPVGSVLQRAGDVVYVPGSAGSHRVDYGFDTRAGVLRTRTYYDEAGSREVVVRYLEYTSIDGQILPGRLQIKNLTSGATVELTLTKATVNPELRPQIFQPPRKG